MSYRNLPSQSMLRWETYARDTFIKTNFSIAPLMSHFFAILEDLEFICPAWNGFHFCSRHRHRTSISISRRISLSVSECTTYLYTCDQALKVNAWHRSTGTDYETRTFSAFVLIDIDEHVNTMWVGTLAELVSLKPCTTSYNPNAKFTLNSM